MLQASFFGDEGRGRRQRWRCLPCPGTYPARKVAIQPAPPPKNGSRGIVVVDGFAGGGGASNGIEKALPRLQGAGLLSAGHPLHVTYAVNHDEPAIAMHAVNHPRTVHLPHNVWQISMRELLGDAWFGLLWLSPDCRDHSPAKGGPITSRAVRDLAWVLVKWLKELPDWQRPWTICIENVLAFAKWSPLIERPDGQGYMRDPERLGWTFHQFVHEVCSYGYSAGWDEMEACKYGVPTIRKRLKLCFRRDGQKIVVPAPTHGDPKSEAVRTGALKPWPVAADIIDFSLDCPSIFMTKEEAREYTRRTGKRIIRPLAQKTDARLAFGVKRHVIDAGDDAFMVTCNHAGEGFRGQGLGDPLATVTRARDAHGLVVPHVAVFRGDSIGKPVGRPLPTPTANSFIKRPGGATPLGICEASVVPAGIKHHPLCSFHNGGRCDYDCARDFPQDVVAPFVSRGQHGGGNRPAGEPIHTIAASDGDQNQVVVPYLVPRYGERQEAWSEATGKARKAQEPRSIGIDRPAPTPVPDGNQGSLAAVYLAQHNNDSRRIAGVNPGRSAGVPVSTLTVEGAQQGVVAASMLSLKGSDRRDGFCEDPHVAVCAGGQHSALVTLPLMTAYYSTGGQHARLGAECGQGWYQQVLPNARGVRGRIATLAPLLHWRVCNVWDWLRVYAPMRDYGGWATAAIADAYGGDEAEERNARTGCAGCPLASKDLALDTIVAMPAWDYLWPLKGLKPLYRELRLPQNRLRKPGLERLKSGAVAANPQRMGPLTFEARLMGLDRVLTIQSTINLMAVQLGRPRIDLLNAEEEARIRELVDLKTWPDGWEGDEPTADTPMDSIFGDGSVQPLLV